MNAIERLHEFWQLDRRVGILAARIEPLLGQGERVLDVGAGDGRIAASLAAARPDLQIEGIDVLARPDAVVPVAAYDGRHIPFGDDAFDTLVFVDVLHHAEDPSALLREASRVAPHVVIKDHLLDGPLAGLTLRVMDGVGNRRHGVALPQHYWSESTWRATWQSLGLTPQRFETRLDLYPLPLRWLFDRRLHFVALLSRADGGRADGLA